MFRLIKLPFFILFLALSASMTVLFAQNNANPALPGFDSEGSDAKAIEIADKVMAAMGGRENWDNTRYVTWKFFGRRLHVWDKWTGNIRFENGDMVVLMNLNSKEGRAWESGEEITDPDSLKKALYNTESAWINDSYWVFMPYKLKDTGVTLKYIGEGKTQNGTAADILQLTFKEVGRTPQNRYLVYVSKESGLVEQFDYFSKAEDSEPRFQSPWLNWQKYGNIMLSDVRGSRKHTDLAVFDRLPAAVFESPAAVDMMDLAQSANK